MTLIRMDPKHADNLVKQTTPESISCEGLATLIRRLSFALKPKGEYEICDMITLVHLLMMRELARSLGKKMESIHLFSHFADVTCLECRGALIDMDRLESPGLLLRIKNMIK